MVLDFSRSAPRMENNFPVLQTYFDIRKEFINE